MDDGLSQMHADALLHLQSRCHYWFGRDPKYCQKVQNFLDLELHGGSFVPKRNHPKCYKNPQFQGLALQSIQDSNQYMEN